MHPQKLAFLRAINGDPRNREIQLVFADWLADHDDPQGSFWRGTVRLGGRGGLVALVGRGGRGGLIGRGRGGRVGRGGLIGSGLGRLGGRGGSGGRGGLDECGWLLHSEAPIVLIEGENVLVFIPHGYGFSVLVGYVAKELPTGWIVDPCREIIDTNNGDCWVALARGDKKLRKDCTYGDPIEDGMRVPLGCMSMVWKGDLPE